MKLRNKKTGEIGKLHCDMNVSPAKYGVFEDAGIRGHYWEYNSLAELNEEWEDYEDPKTIFFINPGGSIDSITSIEDEELAELSDIGNSFETYEEAEKAVEKLKTWKRLKDRGFEFEWVDKNTGSIKFAFFNREGKITKEMWQDIDLLFGGEE